MPVDRIRRRPLAGLAMLALAAAIGCFGTDRERHHERGPKGQRTVEELRRSSGWYDLEAQAAILETIPPNELIEWAQKTRDLRKPAVPSPKKNVLIVSGGGIYGAYPAGVLAGWSEVGTRPDFDVVTGVSTGALVGVFAFLGPAYDCELRRYYTTITNDDIYKRRRFPWMIFAESLADNRPLARMIEAGITDERIAAVATEHRKGRRLYIATSDLDTRRAVVWDMGALASRNTPEDRRLIRDILLATAAIPGFFPPVRIPVTVDGVRYVERHVDGNTSSAMFFVPPYVPAEQRPTLPSTWLHGSNLYALVAGKLYADPVPVKARTFRIAGNAISTVLYDQTRSDLHKLFLVSVLTGMNFHTTAIPKELPVTTDSTDFDPVQMTRLFEAGREWAVNGLRWRQTPPGYEPGEGSKYRAGTVLTDTGARTQVGPPDEMNMMIPVIPEKK
jgi:predicted acylesterase/phospholipase RssA